MNRTRFQEIAENYSRLRLAVIGDYCLDRYLEIDPSRKETSIETGLPVHNVTRVRSQPGAAGTVLNNLVALGVGKIHPVGFCGEDGEGYELRRSLSSLPGICLDHFLSTPDRRTFTYCKPLVMKHGASPIELNRLDSKNWSPTPKSVIDNMVAASKSLAGKVDAVIVMDQVDSAETGVVTRAVVDALAEFPVTIPVVADSRRGLVGYPPVIFKMNLAELAVVVDADELRSDQQIKLAASELARKNGRAVIITLAERGLIGATLDGTVVHVPTLPVRGEIDVVGAGDCVLANITVALASRATLAESLQIAASASSIVIHQLGTTGTASVPQIAEAFP
ncbi:MAG: PfkB family carbohydrate kinase [Pirellulaceae bacterium]